MNDKIAASILARLLAKGLLVGIWVPPQEIREHPKVQEVYFGSGKTFEKRRPAQEPTP